MCRPCFQRAQRRYQNKEQTGTVTHPQQHEYTETSQDDSFLEDSSPEPISVDPLVYDQPEHVVQDQAVQVDRVQLVEIPGYKRAPFNSQLCIYANCSNIMNLRRIHVDIRATILQEKSFYIPRGSRVCEEHSNSVWQEIENNTRGVLTNFSVTMIKDMMDMLRKRKILLRMKPMKYQKSKIKRK